ncbi:MAG: APC family permease [Gemmatimonadetes bacterium]|nr:APC family permease [Gemmatimonadota bacterium]
MSTGLVRAIGRWSLVALMLNGVIGSSVFGLPSVLWGRLGAASPWAWLIAAGAIGLIVACFAEVASRFEGAGGPYLYARVAFGRLAGIEMGWLAYLVRLTASATNANLFVIYLGQFWPGAAGPVASRVVLALVIIPLALANVQGVRGGARVSTVLLIVKLLPLATFALLGLALAVPHPVAHPAAPVPALRDWLDVILILMFAYGGFESALVPLAEAKAPRRDAPFALGVTLLTCAFLYGSAQLVVNAALPDPAAGDRPLAAAAGAFLGPAGATVLALAALVSVTGYLAGAMVNVPRLTFAMAEQGDLPAAFARLHPVHRTPWLSILLFAALVWCLAASSGFLQNLTLSAVSRLFTYGLVSAALPVLRRRERQDPGLPAATLRLPAGPLLALLGFLTSGLLATRMSGRELVVMSVVLLLGLLHWYLRTRPSGEPHIPRQAE